MFRDNIQGTVDFFRTYIYPQPALQLEYPWLAASTNTSITHIPAPKIEVINGGLNAILENTTKSILINKIAIYKLEENTWSLSKVLPVKGLKTDKITGLVFEKGDYVATLVDRFGREGMKTYFEI